MRMLRGVLLCLALAGTAHAAANFPALTGRVVDGAQLLSPAMEQQLTAQSEALEARTGDQFVVVTVPSLNGQAIEEYGYKLGRHWGIGQKGKNNGVLLIVAPKEREVRIEVGYGLEGTLTDALSSGIIQTIILPDFKRGSMEQGIANGAHAVVTLLNGGSVPQLQTPHYEQSSQSNFNEWMFYGIWVIVLFSQFLLFLIYLPFWLLGQLLALFGFNGLLNYLRRKRDRIVPANKSLLAWLLIPSVRFTGSGGGSFRSGGGGGGFSGGGGSFGGGGSSGRW